MSVDGEHSIAFRLPTTLKRQRGHLELITFDVKVEFVEFELKALPTELKLVGASVPTEKPSAVVSSASLPVDQAQLGVTIAQKALNTAEATLASIDARAAADRLRHLGSPSTATASSEQADLQAAAAKE